jgi:hypothetical protein
MKHLLLLPAALLVLAGCGEPEASTTHSHDGGVPHTHDVAQTAAEHGHTHAATVSYLTMNGEFEMDPVKASTRNDARNPSRVRLATSEEAGSVTRMAFYAHDDADRMVADCGYQFVGSRPDPHYFPAQSKSSIWDAFEQVEAYEGACDDYQAVISRSPHGDPVHMHLRYGADVDELLAMSLVPVDSARFEPWWASYCAPGRTESCD